MTLQAWHFTVRRHASGPLVGHALLCPEARYASTRLFSDTQLARGFVHAAQWKTIAADLEMGWAKGVVPPVSAVARALLPGDLEGSCALTFLTRVPIEVTDSGTAAALDGYLLAQAAR